jgi:hypothetical protein
MAAKAAIHVFFYEARPERIRKSWMAACAAMTEWMV